MNTRTDRLKKREINSGQMDVGLILVNLAHNARVSKLYCLELFYKGMLGHVCLNAKPVRIFSASAKEFTPSSLSFLFIL
jgi:hypothetical protein